MYILGGKARYKVLSVNVCYNARQYLLLNIFEELAHAALGQCSNELLHGLAIAESHDGGQRPDVIFLRESVVLICVDGNKINWTTRSRLGVRIIRKLLEDRREHFAGTAPVGIEVDKCNSSIRPRGRRHPAKRRLVNTMKSFEPACGIRESADGG